MYFHADELALTLDPTYLARGRSYWHQGRVLSADLQKDGTLVAGMVRGSGRSVYKLLIRLERTASHQLEITGQCSCPVHYNCKHVAAVLLEVAANLETRTDTRFQGLPLELNIWFDRLRKAGKQQEEDDIPERLLYLLDLEDTLNGRFIQVKTVKVRRRKSGEFSSPSPFTTGSRSSARFVLPADQHILGLLEVTGPSHSGRHRLGGGLGSQTLELLVETGRCHWKAQTGPALQQGAPLISALSWEVDDKGDQRVSIAKTPDRLLLPLSPPWYLDPASGQAGPVDTGLAAPVAETLAAAPRISARLAGNLSQALQQSFPGQPLPAPRPMETQHRDDVQPVPHLRLRSEKDDLYYPGEPEPWEDYAEFWLDYDGVPVHPMDEEPTLVHRRGEGLELILRHADDEIKYFELLLALGLQPDPMETEDEHQVLLLEGEADGWYQLILDTVPQLRAQGWRIEISDDFRYRLIEADEWYATLDETPGNDWFSLELGVDVDGERVNILPILASYLRQIKTMEDLRNLRELPDDTPLMCPLGDGRIINLPLARARHLIEVLTELYDPQALDQEGRLRLSRLQSVQLEDLAGDGEPLTWEGGEEIRSFGQRLRDFDGIQACPPPHTLQAQLRPYQQEGLNWLQFLREYGLGGILADDMGLGKTIQTLAHLLVEKAAGRAKRPSLVVAPTSLMFNWRREAQRFAPSLRVLTLQGLQRKSLFEQIDEHDLVLTTYPLLPRDAEALLAREYHLLILDEAQHIKNPKAKAAETARNLQARHRLCLTGTPLENHLGELWSQFHFLMPGMLGDDKRFRKLFRTPIEKHGDDPRRRQLIRRINPFLLRREKADVAADLPPKTEILSEVELGGAQRDLYETIRVGLQEKVQQEIERKGIQRSQIVILDALLKLRQVCCDPRLLKLDAARKVKQSAKLDLLREMLPEMVEEGRRILLFSQFTTMLGLIEDQLQADKIDYVKLTGRTRDRATPIDRFQAGQVPVFLISLKAGGSGLNLTAADTVIHYDPWWNPAVERQATDRAHRIGQEKNVFVYKLLTRGTVEEKIAQLQVRKQELADALFGGKGGSVALDSKDLDELFRPLD